MNWVMLVGVGFGRAALAPALSGVIGA